MIYMDNAATTRMHEAVAEKMLPYMTEFYGNPSSLYGFSEESRKAVRAAREIIASSLNCKPEEICFTNGGSESDNWALKGVAEHFGKGHIITTQIEHHAVLHTAKYLEKRGFSVTYLPVDEAGLVNPADVEKAIRPDTILISVMFANNEIGTIEPIADIGKIARQNGILFHTDAVQAYAQIPIDLSDMPVDLLSASGHKFNGPKGTGFLFVRKGTKFENLIHGGGQERGMRAGTENVPGIVGLGEAARLAEKSLKDKMEKEARLRNHMMARIEKEIPYAFLNGPRENRLPGNLNFSFRFIEGEGLLLYLDMMGVCASSGSACSAGSAGASHVLTAIGRDSLLAQGSVRLSIGSDNTLSEADEVVDILKGAVEKLREMSPLYSDFIKEEL